MFVCVCVCVCLSVCVCVCVYVCLNVCVSVCVCAGACMRACVRASCVRVRMCACIYIYIYIYIYMCVCVLVLRCVLALFASSLDKGIHAYTENWVLLPFTLGGTSNHLSLAGKKLRLDTISDGRQAD